MNKHQINAANAATALDADYRNRRYAYQNEALQGDPLAQIRAHITRIAGADALCTYEG